MGLFGYSEKDYRINRDKYEVALNKIQENASYMGLDGSIGKTINAILVKINRGEFSPTWKKAEITKVEERITSLINAMSDDIQRKSLAKFSAHVSYLYDSLDARNFGKENRTDEQIRIMETLADGMALIEQAVIKKDDLVKQQEAITTEAANLPQGDSKVISLRAKWKTLQIQIAAEDKNIGVLQQHYEANVRTAASLSLNDVIDSLPARIAEPKDLSASLDKIAKKFERLNADNAAINDITDEFDKATNIGATASADDDAFYASVGAKQAEMMANEINDSEVKASSSGSKQEDIKAPF